MAHMLYSPPEFTPSNDQNFFVTWTGESYRLHDGCPVRTTLQQNYVEVGQFGNVRSIGQTNVGATTYVLTGFGCPESQYQRQVYTLSSNIFNAPALGVWHGIWHIIALFTLIYVFIFAFRMFFGSVTK